MSQPIYLREAVVFCSLGSSSEEIVRHIHEEISPCEKTFTFGTDVKNRKYYGLEGRECTSEETFYKALEELLGQLIHNSGLSSEELLRCALLLGSTSMNIPYSESVFRADHDQKMLPNIGYGVIGERLATMFGIGGEVSLFSTACTSSANALLYGYEGIVSRRYERAIVVGFDFYNELTMSGFESFGLLSQDGCRPFDADRSGLVLGEGCGGIVLDSEPSPKGLNFILRGGANLSDTSSPTAHNLDGVMVEQTIKEALKNTGVTRDEVTLIRAHATGSTTNDMAEARGLHRLFQPIPPLVALKGSLGHTLGGCGVIELSLLWFCMREGFVPKTSGFETMDEEICIKPISDEIKSEEGIILLNHFGFGGNGVVLVVEASKSSEK